MVLNRIGAAHLHSAGCERTHAHVIIRASCMLQQTGPILYGHIQRWCISFFFFCFSENPNRVLIVIIIRPSIPRYPHTHRSSTEMYRNVCGCLGCQVKKWWFVWSFHSNESHLVSASNGAHIQIQTKRRKQKQRKKISRHIRVHGP